MRENRNRCGRVISARGPGESVRGKSSRHPNRQILVYGFRPYLQFATNITAQAIQNLSPRKGLRTVVFPVRFNRAQFVQSIKKHEPDVVLGLGQCSSGARFRIERRALNRRCSTKGTKPVAINSAGPKELIPTLRLQGERGARISRNAGTYVCNYSMYVILDYLRRHRLPTRFGFIHISCAVSCMRATRYLERVLDRLQNSFNSSSARRRH
jgi:pyrrolidone-carboxylate peptidase